MRTIWYLWIILGIAVLAIPATAAPVQPVVDFSANVTSGAVPLAVLFSDGSSPSTGWAWFFGDETYAEPWTEVNASYDWESTAWPPRWYHAIAAVPDGRIILAGGNARTGGTLHDVNDTWQSADSGSTWTLMNASSGWVARTTPRMIGQRDNSVLLTGGDGSGQFWNDVWRSPDHGATWTLVNASAGWSPRESHSIVALPDEPGSIVLTGGWDGGTVNDTWRSSDGGVTWMRVNASSGWVARSDHCSVALPDGSIVLMGGAGYYSIGAMNDTWQSPDGGVTWTLVNSSSGWEARTRHTCVAMPDGSIVLMGGGNGTRWNDVWRSTDSGATWTMVNASAGWWPEESPAGVVVPDGSIVLTLGDDYRAYTWRFAPAGSTEQNPVHTYTVPGTYQVALQASTPGGYNSTRKTAYITVSPAPPPTVTQITPASGQNTTTVSITNLAGTGFYGTPAVNLTKTGVPNITATGVTVIDSTNLTCSFDLSGKTVGLRDIVLINPDGQEGLLPGGFTVTNTTPAPVVNSITPASGVNTGSVYIQDIAGSGFLDGAAVNLTKTGEPNITLANVAVLPAKITGDFDLTGARAGQWNVTVTNPDGQEATLLHGFTVTPYPIGTDTGVFRSGQWILDYGIDGTVNRRFQYGLPSDTPLAGNFSNDGTADIGVFRSGQWILDYGIDGTVNRRFPYGLATDIPVVGDFNNDGTTDIGVFRSGQWILDYGIDGTVNRRFPYGLPTDKPVVADFNNDGTTDIGVFRSGQWILDYGIDGTVNRRFPYGLVTDIPVVGDFNNDGTTDIGVFRSGQWILDYGIDGTVNRRFPYGLATDIPVVGRWV